MNEVQVQGASVEFFTNTGTDNMWSKVEEQLKECKEFAISVAFITEGGLEPLKTELKKLEEKQVPGRILTTDYLTFTEPKALAFLQGLTNIELRIYRSGYGHGFHTKGYLFHHKDTEEYQIIVGSSNMTASAMSTNHEWNTKVTSKKGSDYVDEVYAEFNSLWDSDAALPYEEYKDVYEAQYGRDKFLRRKLSLWQEDTDARGREEEFYRGDAGKLVPNRMQNRVVLGVENLLAEGQTRGLLISATGTGKTYASAFAMRAVKPKRVLFLVHREQIARQALHSFERVLGKEFTYGIISGTAKNTEADYVFATMQTMGKEHILEEFPRDHFDIIIDEAHRSGANTYTRIMDYFTPKFWMGMTASPERTDGFDVYQLFHHNIIHEIRLQQALEHDLLCPFHYFGISMLEVDYQEVSDEASEEFLRLHVPRQAHHVMEMLKLYGYSGDRAKGLVFCRTIEEAKAFSAEFNKKKFRTVALSGSDSQEERRRCVERLATDDTSGDYLDYIFTVDIFNEGVDIPEINQVVMLRPTESPIVFVQQLGRGLRKARDKEFVVVLDFIRHDKNNFMIPMALSGNTSGNKDDLRYLVERGLSVIPGVSSVQFDEVAKERVYESIDKAKLSSLQYLRANYQNLKYKLGRVPYLRELKECGSIEPSLFAENKTVESYYGFLRNYEPDWDVELSEEEYLYITYLTRFFMPGKCKYDLLAVKALLDGANPLEVLNETIQYKESNLQAQIRISTFHMLTGQYLVGTGAPRFAPCQLVEAHEDSWVIHPNFAKLLEHEAFKNILSEIVDYGLQQHESLYNEKYKDTDFVLYKKYTYFDVCRLLHWTKQQVATNIGGYKYDQDTNTLPVFINYKKEDHISDSIRYEDQFESPQYLTAISKSRRTLASKEIQRFLRSKEEGTAIHLFVRKHKNGEGEDGKEFYYLGTMSLRETRSPEEFTMKGTNYGAVKFYYHLDVPVDSGTYSYITRS